MTGVRRRVAAMLLPLRLARRFGRSREIARSCVLVGVAAALLLGMFVLLESLTLSPRQVVERDWGRFQSLAGPLGSVPPGDPGRVREVERAVSRAGARDVMAGLVAVDVQLATGTGTRVTLAEGPWASRPFPERYELVSGRWPARAGEVVVTNSESLVGAGVGRRVGVLSGRAHLDVVGLAEDPYATSPGLLVAEGTWAALDPTLERDFGLFAQVHVFWSGGRDADVAEAVGGTLGSSARQDRRLRAQVRSLTEDRSDAAAVESSSAVSSVPAGYTLPSLLLPGLAVLVVLGLNDRRLRHRVDLLRSLGVSRGKAAVALVVAVAAWSLAAAAAGAAGGLALGWLASRGVRWASDHMTSPVPDVTAPLARLAAVTLLTTALGYLLYRGRTPQPARDGVPPGGSRPSGPTGGVLSTGRGRDVRHLLAVAAACGTVVQATRLNSPPDGMVMAATFAVAVLLLVPDVLGLVVRRLPERSTRLRLARRQLAADRRRPVASVAILASLLGMSLGFLALFETMVVTAGEQSYPAVLPGQMAVTNPDSTVLPAPRDIVRLVEEQPGVRAGDRVPLRFSVGAPGSGVEASVTGSDPFLMVVDDERQLAALLARPLTRAERSGFRRGDVLLWSDRPSAWDGHDGRLSTSLEVSRSSRPSRHLGRHPVVLSDAAVSEWRVGTDGVVRTAVARRLGMPVSTGAVMFAPVPDDVAERARGTVARAGLDPLTVQVHAPPPPPVPPTALYTTAGGLVVLVLLLGVVLTAGQVRALRDYLGLLLTVGVPVRWARQVLLVQHLVVLLVSTILALPIAVVPVVVTAWTLPGFVLSLPWQQLGVVTAAVYVATVAAGLLATRRITSAFRPL